MLRSRIMFVVGVPVVTGDVADDEHDPSVRGRRGRRTSRLPAGPRCPRVGSRRRPRRRAPSAARSGSPSACKQPQGRPLDRPILAGRGELPFGRPASSVMSRLDDRKPSPNFTTWARHVPASTPAAGVAIGVLQSAPGSAARRSRRPGRKRSNTAAVQPVRVALEHPLADRAPVPDRPKRSRAVVLHEVHPEVHDAASRRHGSRCRSLTLSTIVFSGPAELVTLQPFGRLPLAVSGQSDERGQRAGRLDLLRSQPSGQRSRSRAARRATSPSTVIGAVMVAFVADGIAQVRKAG